MRQAHYISQESGQTLELDVPCVLQSEIDSVDASKVAYWLIDMRNPKQGWELLTFIRGHLSASIYLKPVIFLIASDDIPKEVKESSDGNIDFLALNMTIIEETISKVEPINLWIDRLGKRETTNDTNISFKILRIIASRDQELKPLITVRRNSGYAYSILEPLFTKRDTGIMETLNFLQSQSLLSERFITRAHFCGHCSSAFLNFKETCPHCNSDDLDSEELVHHFKCAYTAQISEFQQSDKLVCPKCERRLQHIGVDYDKPSIINRCNSCNHQFQDPVVMTDCYNCGRSAEPSNQDVQQVNAYSITAIGQNAAYYGLDALFTNILESELHLYSSNAFHDFFNVETARIERYKISTSSIAMINFKDLDILYTELGKKAKQVFSELSSIFKVVFRDSDIITAYNESVFFVIMTETNYESALRAIERLEESVTLLFENNLEKTLEIKTMIKEINIQLDLDTALEEFLLSS